MKKYNSRNGISVGILGIILILVFVTSNLFVNQTKTYAAESVTPEKVSQDLNNLSDPNTGLVSCDPYASETSEECSPKKIFVMFGKIVQVAIYFIIFAMVLMIVISGVGVVYSSNRAQLLSKWKGRLKKSVMALIILVAGTSIVLGVLAAAGLKSEVLDVLKGLFAMQDFSIFPHALAQNTNIASSAQAVAKQSGSSYVDFFGGQSLGSIVLLIMKFLINYIVAPALVLATVIAGFNFVKAEGNPEKLAKAKKFAMYVVLGIVASALAYTLVSVILNTITDIQSKTKTSLNIQQNLEISLVRNHQHSKNHSLSPSNTVKFLML